MWRHWNLEPGSFDVNRKVAVRERVLAGGRDVIVVFGGVRSSIHVVTAGVGSAVIPASVAMTSNVWVPAVRPWRTTGDVQGPIGDVVVLAGERVAAGLVRRERERRGGLVRLRRGPLRVVALRWCAVGDRVERAEELQAAVAQDLEIGGRVDGVEKRGLELRDRQRRVAREEQRRGARQLLGVAIDVPSSDWYVPPEAARHFMLALSR